MTDYSERNSYYDHDWSLKSPVRVPSSLVLAASFHMFFVLSLTFSKVSVVNMVHRKKKGGNVRKSSFGGRTKAQVCRPTYMHNFAGPIHKGRTS